MSKTFVEYARGAKAVIVTAERLFGEFGLDGVSLRQITAAAGQSNASVVHHHFGSKAGLIQAVYEMRTPAIEAARQAKLDALDRNEQAGLADLLAALLEPIIEALTDQDRMLYARFMMRLLPLDQDEHPYFKCLHLCGPSVEISRRMQDSLPHLPPEILNTRIRMAVAIFLQGIWDAPRVQALHDAAYASREMFWDEIFQMALSVFGNPFPPPVRFGHVTV
ncbi:MAG: hypothetical protein JWR77_1316 [Rhizorhabdus sp.]|nr:hypothetical protein [Rhizorhabdus sp.]